MKPAPATINGRRAWLIWATAAGFFFYSFFHRVTPSVMVSDLMREFTVGATVLGTLSAFYFYPYAVLQLPVGVIIDRWGPRRILTGAAVVAGFGSLLFAAADSLTVAYAGRFMIGTGVAFGWIGALSLTAIWFPPRRFAMLAGATSMMGVVGAINGQASLSLVVDGIGWRATMVWAAALGFVVAALVWIVVRDTHAAAPVRARATWGDILRGARRVLTESQTWIVGYVNFTGGMLLMAFGGLWAVPYMIVAHGLSRPTAAMAASMVMVGWGIGAPLNGWVSDRIGRRKAPLAAGILLAGIALMTVIYVPGLPLPAIFILLVLTGFGASGSIICYALARENNPAPIGATAMATVNAMTMLAGAFGQPLIGWLLDANWSGTVQNGVPVYAVATYQTAFLSLAAVWVLALVACALVRETGCRPLEDRPANRQP